MSFIAGIVLEIAHLHSDDTIRGVIFFFVGILLLIPSGEFVHFNYIYRCQGAKLILLSFYLYSICSFTHLSSSKKSWTSSIFKCLVF